MKRKKFRIYAEVKEQAHFFKDSLIGFESEVELVSTNAAMLSHSNTSIIALIRNQKKFDLLVSEIKDDNEFPLLMVEFSTAVSTDDHEMQRGDALFWSYTYKIPYLKIAPSDKYSQTAGRNFGGGNLLSPKDQIIQMFKSEGVMYHIEWKSLEKSAYTHNDVNYPSCPDSLNELTKLMNHLIKVFEVSNDRSTYYKRLHEAQSKDIVLGKKLYEWSGKRNELIEKFGSKTSRIEYDISQKRIKVKVNRYGHAMDPERGMIAFWRLVLGRDWEITAEFQVGRDSLKSYESLFDGLSQEKKLIKKIEDIYSKGNIVSIDDAIYLHEQATSSGRLGFEKTIKKKVIKINSETLNSFMFEGIKTSAFKNLLYYVDNIVLSDQKRNVICKIIWENNIVEEYYSILISDLGEQLKPLPLKGITKKDISEDLITWATKQILVESGYEILAISYPGAQGDRCVLIGKGKKVLRQYIDIIAISPNHESIVLIESKKKLKDSLKDCDKINNLVINNYNEVLKLVESLNINKYKYNKIETMVGGLIGKKKPYFTVDYIIEFDFDVQRQTLVWQSNLKGLETKEGEISLKDVQVVAK